MGQSIYLPAAVLLLGAIAAACFARPRHMTPAAAPTAPTSTRSGTPAPVVADAAPTV
jgi:hypothetical protein